MTNAKQTPNRPAKKSLYLRFATGPGLKPLSGILLGVTIAFFALTIPANSQVLLQSSDLQYVGAFRVPQGTFGTSTLNYGGTGLTYYSGRNSLLVVGHDWDQEVAEISIPQATNSSSLSNLKTATILQPFRDASDGKSNSIKSGGAAYPNTVKVGGLFVSGGKLIGSVYAYYDGAVEQDRSHFTSGMDLSVSGDAQGMFKVGTEYPGFVSGYMTAIPQQYQSALGGPALTGNCCLAINGVQSSGPSASVFNPVNFGVQDPVPATMVVGYPHDHATLGSWDNSSAANPVFNMSTQIKGIVFPEGTRSVLFFGMTGLGKPCYGTGSECNDPDNDSKGTHAYPYSSYVWAYDVSDLISVKNGQKNPWDIKPYATWTLGFPTSGGKSIVGAAYDPATQRIYLAQYCTDAECYPVIHVYSVANASGVQKPMPPQNLRIK
jgi:hypothetical protein